MISDNKKLDILWKKNFGLTETSIDGKSVENETIISPNVTFNQDVWGDSSAIDVPPPSSDNSVVKVYDSVVNAAIRCKNDDTVPNKRTWVAVSVFANPIDATNILIDWIPPTFHPNYAIKVYAGDPTTTGILLNPTTLNEEYIFDYSAGVLYFPNLIPIEVDTNGIWIQGFRYIGLKGFQAVGGSGILTINGLTTDPQYFSTSTLTYNDFTIDSSGSTHTFYLPTASATKRGALSTSDWTTFNNKQTALGYTPVNKAGDTLTGLLIIPASTGIQINTGAPGTTTNKLYQISGSLYFDGVQLGSGTFGGAPADFASSASTGVASTYARADHIHKFVVSGIGASFASNTLTITTASGGTSGLLSSSDWTTFNNKQAALGYTPVNKAGDSMTGTLTVSGSLVISGSMSVNTGVGISISSGAPGTTSNKLYQIGGSLYFNGSVLSVGAAPGGAPADFTSSPANAGVAVTYARSDHQHRFHVSGIGMSFAYGATQRLTITTAGASSDGLLSQTDWNIFNNKLDTLTNGTGISISGSGTSRTIAIVNPVAVNTGGTGKQSYTAGNILYASGSTTIAELTPNSTMFDITGSTLILKDSGISEAKLDITNTPGAGQDGYSLTWNNSAGKPTWALVTSGSSTLGAPTDGSFADGAITNWVINTTTIPDAIDDLNETLGKLVPAAPPALSTITLAITGGGTVSGVNGLNIFLASGVTDYTSGGTPPTSGTLVYRVTSSTVATSVTTGFGSGTSGTLTAVKNGSSAGSRVLTTGFDNGTYTSLIIDTDVDYPVLTPGFWQSLTAHISSSVAGQAGLHRYQLTHTNGGNTNTAYFVYDDTTVTPVVSGLTVVENTPGTLVYQSGIPHYPSGAILDISGTVADLVSKTYSATNLVSITNTSATTMGTASIDPGQNGINTFTADTVSHTFTNKSYTIGGAADYVTTQIKVRANNPGFVGSYATASTLVNVMKSTFGSVASPVRELELWIDTLGTTPGGASSVGKRIVLTNGSGSDNPNDNVTALTDSPWVVTDSLPVYEAKVVGGILTQSQVNYASGYLPAGPNYSSHNATQYATYFLRRSAVSQFKIVITGSFAGCWVKLPGLSGTPVNAGINDWWDMFTLYAGSGIPNRGANNAGCAYTGAGITGLMANGTNNGTYGCTFGTESSTNSSNNIIMVRFKLTSGQSITSLKLSS